MKHIYVFLLFFVGLQPSFLTAQSEYPNEDIDYKVSFSDEEQGTDYTVFSYCLENISNEKILFFNFFISSEDTRFEAITPLPEDVLILEPGNKAVYYKVKVFFQSPSVSWSSQFMRVTEEGEFPLLNRDYVFYDEYVDHGTNITRSYFIKNISDRGIRFYDFSISNENIDNYVYRDIPASMVGLRTGQYFPIYQVSVLPETPSPAVNWYSIFIDDEDDNDYYFYQEDYDFCEGILHIMNESKTGFKFLKGPIKSSTRLLSFIDQETLYCSVHIPGFNNEVFEGFTSEYTYYANIGHSGSIGVVDSRMDSIRTRLRECLPSTMTETDVAEEDRYLSIKEIRYEGAYEGDSQYIILQIIRDYVSDDLFKLQLKIDEP